MFPKYRQQPPKPSDEDFSSQMVMSSSTELFGFYRLTFAQCAKLSTGAPLVELSKLFAKYLDQYAHQILLYHISERPSGQTPSRFPTIEDTVIVLNKLQSVSDQSPYVTELLQRVKARASEILAVLHKQQYARAFCDNLVELLASAYTVNLVQCRPISEIAAEQVSTLGSKDC